MKVSQTKDLTQGVPVRVLSVYALPMLISMFFQQAYNLVDAWIAGNYIGAVALGAVGACYPVTVFLLAISAGLSLGISIFCSQAYGAKNYGTVKTAVNTALMAYLPLSVGISVIGFYLAPLLLKWLAVPAEAQSAALGYLRIYLLGFAFQFLYNICSGVMTGLGNSQGPLLFLIVSSVCNIVLDYVLVARLHFGVTGLALATVMSQLFAALFGMKTVAAAQKALADRGARFSREILGSLIRLGVPSMIQQMLMSLGQLAMQYVINGYGLIVMAGYSIAFRVNGLVINSLMALSNALSGFIAQNQGAGKPERIRSGISASLFLSYLFSACVILVLYTYSPQILGFFLEDSAQAPQIISVGTSFLSVVAPFYLLVCAKIVFDGALRGVGAMWAFMFSTMSDVFVRVLCGAPFSARWGLGGVWAVWPTAWLIGTAMSVGLYLCHSHRHQKA